jgi:hypothetical protein
MAADRPLPHDKDAEVHVLGGIIVDARNFRKASRLVGAQDFFFPEHRIIYEALSQLAADSKPTDEASLIAHLSDRGLLEKAGGAAYVAQLADGVYKLFDVAAPAMRVRELSVLRQIAKRADMTRDAALRPGANSRDVLQCGISGLRELIPHAGGAAFTQAGTGAEIILDAVERFIVRFVFVSETEAGLIALWVAHTHAFTAATSTPYLFVSSAEMQSGKTRLLEVLDLLVATPWYTGKTSAAALVRKIDRDRPTLLLDESDAAFHADREYAEALRGILNTGHRIGGKASVCVGQGKDITVRDFSTFCPKAIAGLRRLPDTVADRSIPIVLKRAVKGEIPEKFRRKRIVVSEATELRDRVCNWVGSVFDKLDTAEPCLPDSLSDRQQDGAEPLLAIADAAGGDWPYKAREALVSILTRADRAESHLTRLLADIREIFQASGTERIRSTELAGKLAGIETSPWGEWSRGKPISTTQLARLLARFGIAPQTIRFGGDTGKGYAAGDFQDAWGRYLPPYPPPQGVTPSQAAKNGANSQIGAATEGLDVTAADQQKTQ